MPQVDLLALPNPSLRIETSSRYRPTAMYTIYRFSISHSEKLKLKGSSSSPWHWWISSTLSIKIKISLKWKKQIAAKLMSRPVLCKQFWHPLNSAFTLNDSRDIISCKRRTKKSSLISLKCTRREEKRGLMNNRLILCAIFSSSLSCFTHEPYLSFFSHVLFTFKIISFFFFFPFPFGHQIRSKLAS